MQVVAVGGGSTNSYLPAPFPAFVLLLGMECSYPADGRGGGRLGGLAVAALRGHPRGPG